MIWTPVERFQMLTDVVVESILKESECLVANKFSDFKIPAFDGENCVLAKFEYDSNDFLNCDGFPWYRKKKGLKEIKPRVRSSVLSNGIPVKVYNCSMVDFEEVRKYVVLQESKNLAFILYVSTISVNKERLMAARDSKSKRIDKRTVELVRNSLVGRNVKCATKLLKEARVTVTSKQVRNQARMVADTIKIKRGPRPITCPTELSELARTHRFSCCHVEKNEFRFIYVNENLFSIFTKNLPSKKQLRRYRAQFDGIEEWSTTNLNEYIELNSDFFVGGVDKRVAASAQIDTTFDLCSCYVTVFSAYLNPFITKESRKLRHCPIAFMLHSSKKEDHHVAFRDEISKTLLEFDPKIKKRIPSVVHDGESAFSAYTQAPHFEECAILRCDLHRRSNIERSTARLSDSDRKKLFGKMDGKKFVKRGIFGALSMKDFSERLEKSRISEETKEWIEKRKDQIYETHSLKTKILAGLFLLNVTTNNVECINSKIKTVLNRPERGELCASKLITFMQDEEKCLFRSIFESDDLVEFRDYNCQDSHLSYRSKMDLLLKIGFSNVFQHILKVPFGLENLIPKLNFNDIIELEALKKQQNYLVQKKLQTRSFVEVTIESDGLPVCQNENCKRVFPELCAHLFAVLLMMPSDERENSLRIISDKVSLVTIRQSERAKERRGQANRFKRKYTTFSRNNRDRQIGGFLDDTLTLETTGTVGTETQEDPENTFSALFDQSENLASLANSVAEEGNEQSVELDGNSETRRTNDTDSTFESDTEMFMKRPRVYSRDSILDDSDEEVSKKGLEEVTDSLLIAHGDGICFEPPSPSNDTPSTSASTRRSTRKAPVPQKYRDFFAKKTA